MFKRFFSYYSPPFPLPVVAGMATMPTRSDTFPIALKSIMRQVDYLYLFLDNFDDVPPLAINDKIEILRSQDYGDLKANGKFVGLNRVKDKCYFLTVDDDIYYPRNYVYQMINFYSKLSAPAVLGVHGTILNSEINSYKDDRLVYHRSDTLKNNIFVDIIGTDGAFLRTDILKFDVTKWNINNMVDIHFALECARCSLPRIAVKRKRGWIKCLAEEQPDSIYKSLLSDCSKQTILAKKLIENDPCKMLVSRR